MPNPSFGPGHHPILDLEPGEFVRKANAAGMKLARAGYGHCEGDRYGCALGTALVTVNPDWRNSGLSVRDILGITDAEHQGIIVGFDWGRRPEPGGYLDADEQIAGAEYGMAVRAAALEIQGDLEPTPLKREDVKS